MLTAALYAADILAIGILVLGLYFPRHRRRDLVVAYVGINVGVMAVSSVLLSTAVGAGLGLGLFGVLSIIRLRSRSWGGFWGCGGFILSARVSGTCSV